MKITITATLTPEQVFTLSQEKGYQEKVMTPVEKEENYEAYTMPNGEEVPAGKRKITVIEEVQNTQSREDFIRQVYEGMVSGDASRIFIDFRNRAKEAERIAEENAIRESVANSITSSVGN